MAATTPRAPVDELRELAIGAAGYAASAQLAAARAGRHRSTDPDVQAAAGYLAGVLDAYAIAAGIDRDDAAEEISEEHTARALGEHEQAIADADRLPQPPADDDLQAIAEQLRVRPHQPNDPDAGRPDRLDLLDDDGHEYGLPMIPAPAHEHGRAGRHQEPPE